MVQRVANQQAQALHRQHLLQAFFTKWWQHTQDEKEYSAKCIRAARFWLHKRMSQSIMAWREWVLQHRHIRTASALAVRHWSIRVRWSVWVAWRAYTQQKHEGLMRKAASTYKAHVTKAGKLILKSSFVGINYLYSAATHWLKVGFATRTARMQQGQQREAQYAINLFNLVERLARRWRSIVAHRKHERLQAILVNNSNLTTNITTPTNKIPLDQNLSTNFKNFHVIPSSTKALISTTIKTRPSIATLPTTTTITSTPPTTQLPITSIPTITNNNSSDHIKLEISQIEKELLQFSDLKQQLKVLQQRYFYLNTLKNNNEQELTIIKQHILQLNNIKKQSLPHIKILLTRITQLKQLVQ